MTSTQNYLNKPKIQRVLQWLVLALLVAILAITLYEGVRNFESLKSEGFMRPSRRSTRVLGAQSNLSQIQVWMTFRYINMIFNLPPVYLKTQLNITDPNYPNISVAALARQRKIKSGAELAQVIAAVKESLNKISP